MHNNTGVICSNFTPEICAQPFYAESPTPLGCEPFFLALSRFLSKHVSVSHCCFIERRYGFILCSQWLHTFWTAAVSLVLNRADIASHLKTRSVTSYSKRWGGRNLSESSITPRCDLLPSLTTHLIIIWCLTALLVLPVTILMFWARAKPKLPTGEKHHFGCDCAQFKRAHRSKLSQTHFLSFESMMWDSHRPP